MVVRGHQRRRRQTRRAGRCVSSEERYRTLVESSPDATLIYRGDIVEFANAAALKLFGASTPGQVVGHVESEFVHRARHAADQQSGLWEQKFVRLDGSVVRCGGAARRPSSTSAVPCARSSCATSPRGSASELELAVEPAPSPRPAGRRHSGRGLPQESATAPTSPPIARGPRAMAWLTQEGLYGKTDPRYFSPAERAQGNIEEDERVLSSRKELRIERVLELKGEMRWFETIKTPLFEQNRARSAALSSA